MNLIYVLVKFRVSTYIYIQKSTPRVCTFAFQHKTMTFNLYRNSNAVKQRYSWLHKEGFSKVMGFAKTEPLLLVMSSSMLIFNSENKYILK